MVGRVQRVACQGKQHAQHAVLKIQLRRGGTEVELEQAGSQVAQPAGLGMECMACKALLKAGRHMLSVVCVFMRAPDVIGLDCGWVWVKEAMVLQLLQVFVHARCKPLVGWLLVTISA